MSKVVARVTGICAVSMLVLCGPGALPALADSSSSSVGQPPAPPWQPPPLQLSQLPADGNPGPPAGTTYQKKYQCVQSNVGTTTVLDQPLAQSMLDIRGAQALSTGKGVTVAIIDTGVNPHPYLGTRLHGGGDYVDPSNGQNGTTDCDGHGTLTAGIIGANTSGQNVGFTGVAPDVNLVAIRQTSQVYTSTDPTTNAEVTAGTPLSLAQAIVHAANLPGVGVITTSINACLPATVAAENMADPRSGDPALEAAVYYASVVKNIVVVNSAGNIPSSPDNNGQGQGGQSQQGPCSSVPQNNNPDPNDVKQVELPAAYSDYVLSVASVDPVSGGVSSFSEWGPWVGVAAPGEDIVSIDPGQGGTGLSDLYAEPGSNNKPGPIQGTSFAAPYVAGVAALVRARFPTMSAQDVIYRLEATAQHPAGPGGRNNQVGYGLIDPVAALTAAVPGQNGVPRQGSIQIPARLPGTAPTDWPATRVALIGTAIGAALLLITLFVMRTVRHNRASREQSS